ncbi:MAG: UDP-N-acetylmuramate dehydrogenase [Actinobacteria bacterium]|nr:UDP-N-acetylmuramate dehydrogenase [Actinomycetota bacterium]
MRTTEQVRLAEHTTLRLGGPAARFSVAATEPDLVAAVAAADREGEPVLVLGGGSNLVVGDAGFPGVVVQVACHGATFAVGPDAVEVTAPAGQNWDELVRQCLAEALSGVECLSGIPGTAGATPIQNVGAYGQEVAEVITAVRAYDRLDRQIVRLGPADLAFGYRTSMFKRLAAEATRQAAEATRQAGEATSQAPEPTSQAATGRYVVLDVTFRLPRSSQSAPVRYGELARLLGVAEGARVPAADARNAVLELRRGKGMVLDDGDPDTRSAGSFFTNPVVAAERLGELSAELSGEASVPHWPAGDSQIKLSAAWLIERAGFSRGFRLADDPEGARISTKHTLALTNPGHATTAGLIRLARAIRDGVRSRFGVELTIEPTLVGVTL